MAFAAMLPPLVLIISAVFSDLLKARAIFMFMVTPPTAPVVILAFANDVYGMASVPAKTFMLPDAVMALCV